MPSTVAGTHTRGVLPRGVFGPSLLGIMKAARTKDNDFSTMGRQLSKVERSVTNSTSASSAAGAGGGRGAMGRSGEEDDEDHVLTGGKERDEDDDYNDGGRVLEDERNGSDTFPGRFQVRYYVEKNQPKNASAENLARFHSTRSTR